MHDPQRPATWESFDAKAFYEELGEKYPEAQVVYSTLEGRLRKAFVRKFLSQHRGTLLDVGCNVGIHLEGYDGPKIGIDLAESVLRTARKRIPDGRFFAGNAESMGFLQAESVDVILCTEVLEHIERPGAAIAEFARVLRPGGRALVSTPNREETGQREWIEADILDQYGIAKQAYYHGAFTPDELGELARTAGLQVEEQGSFGHETRYCGKLPNAFYELGTRINNHTFKSRRLNDAMLRWCFRMERVVYRTIAILGLRRVLNRRVPHGKFSYVIALKKPATRNTHS